MAPVIAGADRTAEMVTPASAGVVIPETVMHYDSLGAIAGDYTLTPPAGDVWRILSVKFIFFAAGAAGNRVLNVAFDYGLGSTLMWMSGNQVLHGAGVGYRYLFAPGATPLGPTGNSEVRSSMADCFVFGGPLNGLHIQVANVQVGDNLANVGVIYERWLG